jgi:hypothetical protein
MSTYLTRTFTAAIVTAACVLAAPSAARADWIVSPFVGAHVGGDAPRTSPAVGVSGGWMGTIVGGEVDLGYGPEFFAQNGFTTDRRMLTVMGNVIVTSPWGSRDTFKPYVSGGLGVLEPKLSEAGGIFALDAKKLGMDVGGGAMGFFNRTVGLRGDIRYFRGLRKSDDDTNAFGLDLSTFHFWRASVGLAVRF